MRYRCVRAKENGSRSQYAVEGILEVDGGKSVPFYFMVLPFHASFQTVSDSDGEKLVEEMVALFGEPSKGPDVVKGGACGGEMGEIAEELDIHTAMMSVVWEDERFDRSVFLGKLKDLFSSCVEG